MYVFSWLLILPVDQNARASPRQRYSSSGSALHHASFRPSHLDSPQEPAKDRVAPLRPIALRRSSQWRNHQKTLREKLRTQGTVQKLSQSLKYSPSVKKYSKRAYLRSSLESLIYLCTFSLLTVTHLNTCLASSCTRVTIWSVQCLSVTSYSSGCSTKLPMQGVTRCIAALERDLFCVASTGCHHAHLLCGLAGRYHDLLHLHIVYVLGNCSLALTSGQGMIIWQPHPPCLYFLKALTSLPNLSAMCPSQRSLTTWSPRTHIRRLRRKLVTAGLHILEIGERQDNTWRLHRLPDVLPLCQPGVPFNTPILSLAATSSLPTTWSVHKPPSLKLRLVQRKV